MNWSNELKIAIIEENENKIYELISNLPQFNSLKEAKEAINLMQEAYRFILKKMEETKKIMKNLKVSKSFLESEQLNNIHRLLDKIL